MTRYIVTGNVYYENTDGLSTLEPQHIFSKLVENEQQAKQTVIDSYYESQHKKITHEQIGNGEIILSTFAQTGTSVAKITHMYNYTKIEI